jgi:hypothetical protein
MSRVYITMSTKDKREHGERDMTKLVKMAPETIKKLTNTEMLLMKAEIFVILSTTIWFLTLVGK